MNFLKNLKIRMKLLLGFGLMIVVICTVSATSYTGFGSIKDKFKNIFSIRMPSINLLLEIDRDLQQLLVAELSLIFENAKSEMFASLVKDYEENFKQAEERREKYKNIKGLNEQDLELIKL